MSSVPIKEKQLGLKQGSRPEGDDNAGFESKKAKAHLGENWGGSVEGKTKHTYKAGD